jgi:hypothetical protein
MRRQTRKRTPGTHADVCRACASQLNENRTILEQSDFLDLVLSMFRCTQAAMRAIAAAIFVIAVGAQEVAMPAIAFSAPAAEVVVLPDPTACSNEAMLAFTAKNRDCASALYWRDNPGILSMLGIF